MTTRVIFQPSGIAAELEDQPTVLQLARRVGVDLDSVCAGRGLCGRCQVTMATGEFPKWGLTVDADALSPPGPVETDYHGNRPLAADHRLGCATRILGDVVIDIPPHSQVHRQVVRKGLDLGATPVRLDPVNTAMYLEPAAPELDGPASTTEILRAAWTAAGHHGRLQFDPATIPHLAVASSPNASTGGVTLIFETATLETDQPALRAVYPGLGDSILGICINVGSTTVAGHRIALRFDHILVGGGVRTALLLVVSIVVALPAARRREQREQDGQRDGGQDVGSAVRTLHRYSPTKRRWSRGTGTGIRRSWCHASPRKCDQGHMLPTGHSAFLGLFPLLPCIVLLF